MDPKYNMGNTPFELSIRQSTEIIEKGWYGAEEIESAEATKIKEWKDIAEMEGKKIRMFIQIKIN